MCAKDFQTIFATFPDYRIILVDTSEYTFGTGCDDVREVQINYQTKVIRLCGDLT